MPEPSASHQGKLNADVVVIGGGPAGCAAARLLAQWDRSVVLIARAPSRRAIAESLPPSCTKLLDAIGVRHAVDSAGFVRATGNTVQWAGGDRRAEQFANGCGYQIARDRFDALLSDAAQAAGAHVIRGSTVRKVTTRDGESRVDYDAPEGTATIRARWVLDCSGRAGIVARAGYRKPEIATRTTALVGVWESDAWADTEFATHTLVESYDGGWAWSVPVTLERRYVTVMLDPRQSELPSRDALESAYRQELSCTSMLRELIDDAELRDAPWGCDASPYRAERASDDGLLLVGDAASFIDPLSSFGVKKALASAWLASVVVNTGLADSAMSGPARELYEERERAMYMELQHQAAALARDVLGAHATGFWCTRADVAGERVNALEAAVARRDSRVLAAFEDLKQRSAIDIRMKASAHIVQRAVVRGNMVVLEEHLAGLEFPDGVRYCRNVDLLRIARVADQHDQVPDLYAAYNQSGSTAPLPDFLAALSSLIAFDLLSLA